MTTIESARPVAGSEPESTYSWLRLLAGLTISTIGGVGLWSVVVVLPVVQAEFGVDRAGASLPYTLGMVGFVIGGPLMGWLADRFGIVLPVAFSAVALAVGYIGASQADSLWAFALMHGVIGMLGSSASFGPIIADVSQWFTRRRGIAVAICSSGSYLAGTIWPLVIAHFTETVGWRTTYLGIGAFCVVTMLPLALALRRPSPASAATPGSAHWHPDHSRPLGLSPHTLQALLIAAGLLCCIAMAMPQVHIVAYCADLGYGTGPGAQLLAVMLGAGIISRLGSGWIADRIGPLPTLLLGSTLQAVALLLYLSSDALFSLYVFSALFGLFQGGIVPSYALIVRQYFPAAEAGTRIGLVLSATLAGMAVGGWMSGAIYDATLSYQAAFLNGAAWNLLNMAIAGWLLLRARRRRAAALA